MKTSLRNVVEKRAFTLIELLIVVAIIAILAAIAVPNFLEAQTRSKVSRARADIRSAATALEAYRVDNNHYPPTPYCDTSFDGGVLRVIPNRLSTPVAYISSANLLDPFISANLADFEAFLRTPDANGEPVIGTYSPDSSYPGEASGDPRAGRRFYYQNNRDPRRVSFGPDTTAAIEARAAEGEWVMASLGPNRVRDLSDPFPGSGLQVLIPYDPTNGTISGGDVVRTQKSSDGELLPN